VQRRHLPSLHAWVCTYNKPKHPLYLHKYQRLPHRHHVDPVVGSTLLEADHTRVLEVHNTFLAEVLDRNPEGGRSPAVGHPILYSGLHRILEAVGQNYRCRVVALEDMFRLGSLGLALVLDLSWEGSMGLRRGGLEVGMMVVRRPSCRPSAEADRSAGYSLPCAD
jgi:hypothetical protein